VFAVSDETLEVAKAKGKKQKAVVIACAMLLVAAVLPVLVPRMARPPKEEIEKQVVEIFNIDEQINFPFVVEEVAATFTYHTRKEPAKLEVVCDVRLTELYVTWPNFYLFYAIKLKRLYEEIPQLDYCSFTTRAIDSMLRDLVKPRTFMRFDFTREIYDKIEWSNFYYTELPEIALNFKLYTK